MKIIVISDTHGQEQRLKDLKGDILIHCGDMEINSIIGLNEMNEWFGSLDFEHKICIAGNHDFFCEGYKEECKKLFTNAIYLENEGCEINGLKFWGSPYTPKFNNWAFMYERCSVEAKKNWSQIPEGLDFLITHCPPYTVLDECKDGHQGCEVLQRAVFDKKPKYHCFGHLHLQGGECINQHGINFYNVSVLDEKYKLINKPTVLEI